MILLLSKKHKNNLKIICLVKTKPIFKKKSLLSNYLIFFLIFFISVLILRKFTLFLFITIIVSMFTYFNYHIKLPFDLSPVLFFSLFFSREYSLFHSFFFIIFSGIIPMILAGGSFDVTTLYYFCIRFSVNFLNVYLRSFVAIPVYIFMFLLDHFFGSLGAVFLFSSNPIKEFLNLIVQIITDLFYLFAFLWVLRLFI